MSLLEKVVEIFQTIASAKTDTQILVAVLRLGDFMSERMKGVTAEVEDKDGLKRVYDDVNTAVKKLETSTLKKLADDIPEDVGERRLLNTLIGYYGLQENQYAKRILEQLRGPEGTRL
jgi:hypothetical protein